MNLALALQRARVDLAITSSPTTTISVEELRLLVEAAEQASPTLEGAAARVVAAWLGWPVIDERHRTVYDHKVRHQRIDDAVNALDDVLKGDRPKLPYSCNPHST